VRGDSLSIPTLAGVSGSKGVLSLLIAGDKEALAYLPYTLPCDHLWYLLADIARYRGNPHELYSVDTDSY